MGEDESKQTEPCQAPAPEQGQGWQDTAGTLWGPGFGAPAPRWQKGTECSDLPQQCCERADHEIKPHLQAGAGEHSSTLPG